MILYVIDGVAAVLLVIGFHLVFRQRALRAWAARLGRRRGGPAAGAPHDPEGVASVLRMIGVMIMAFSFTSAVLANLIAYYSANGIR